MGQRHVICTHGWPWLVLPCRPVMRYQGSSAANSCQTLQWSWSTRQSWADTAAGVVPHCYRRSLGHHWVALCKTNTMVLSCMLVPLIIYDRYSVLVWQGSVACKAVGYIICSYWNWCKGQWLCNSEVASEIACTVTCLTEKGIYLNISK